MVLAGCRLGEARHAERSTAHYSKPSDISRCREIDEPCTRCIEAAAIEVEPAQVIFEVDVKPLASDSAGFSCRNGYEGGSDPLALYLESHHGVEDEGMRRAIPGDVHETDEGTSIPAADPAEAVLVHQLPPVIIRGSVREGLRVQPVDLGIVESAAPRVNHHRAKLDGVISTAQLPSAQKKPSGT